MTGSLVVIRRYSSDFEAQLARAILEANGIAAVVLHDDAGGMLPSLSFVEGVRLAVRTDRVEDALELLADDGESDGAPPDER